MTTHGIHVTKMEVSNFHRIRAASVELGPGGRVVRVTGKNRQGKTSLLLSIAAAMGGKSEVRPDAVNDSAEDGTGSVRLTLSNGFTIERRFTEAAPKGYLSVTGPDGGDHKQAKLSSWLGTSGDFDPLAFFQLPEKRQAEILFGLGPDPELAETIDAMRAGAESLYKKRTPLLSEKQKLERTGEPTVPRPADEGGRAELLQEKAGLEEVLQADIEADRRIRNAENFLENAKRYEREALKRVEDLEAEIALARNELDDRRNDRAAAEAQAEEAKGTRPDIEPARARHKEITAILDDPARIEAETEWRMYEKGRARLEEVTAEAAELTGRIEGLRAQERTLIADADLPVTGVTFDPETGSPLLNGHPLAVASGAERIRLAVEVAIATNPDLRVCLIDEGNDLDLDALRELGTLAKEKDFQVWLCRIGLEGPGEIVVDDGVAQVAG